MYRDRHQEKFNKRMIMVIALLMYGWAMYYAATSSKRWLGPCIDGPKHQWEQRMLAEIDK